MYTLVQNAKLKNRAMRLPKLMVTGCAGNVGRMMESAFCAVFDYDLIGVDSKKNIQIQTNYRKEKLGSEHYSLDYLTNQKEFSRLLTEEKVEKVAHLASLSRPEANKNYELAKRTHVEGTKILIDLIKKNSDLSKMHIFYGSCMSVYGDRRENPKIQVTDEPKPMPHDYFAKTKLESEHLIRDSGIPYTIFRYAPICDHLDWWVDLKSEFFFFELDQKIEWITSRDSAKAIKQAIYKSEKINKQTFNIGGGANLIMRHRDFMKEIFNARGIQIKKPIDLEPTAFANHNNFGGYFADSDYSNSTLGYRMQPIDTAYLRQMYRYPFPFRWLNKKLPLQMSEKYHYEHYSPIYKAIQNKEEEFLKNNFSIEKMLPRQVVEDTLNQELAAEQEERDVLRRQLASIEKRHEEEFEEAKRQRDIREEIEEKWRLRRVDLIAAGDNPDKINLDEIDKLEAEEKLNEEKNGKKEKKEKELTEEEKQREIEIEEEEREKEKRAFGY